MFNFFHNIAGKIAVAISSIFLLFSGTAATPLSTTQPTTLGATSSVQVSQEVLSTTSSELSEIEQLRKEIEALKSGQAAPQKRAPVPSKPDPLPAEAIGQSAPTITQLPAVPSESKLELSNVRVIPSSHEILIQWNTNIISSGTVTLWPTATVTGNIVEYTSNTTSHQVKIATLPDKTYHYLVEARSPSGQIATSEQKDVTTPIDNVAPVVDSITISRTEGNSLLNFTIGASEPVKIALKYNYHTTMDEEGAFTTISTDKFFDESHVAVPLGSWLPFSSVITFKITAYDQSLNPSSLLEQTTKISDITVKSR